MAEIKKNDQGLKKTPMYDYYVEKGFKLTDFGGWALPVQISGIQQEHEAVRNAVGLFDASHMGEVRITSGKENVFDWWNGIITNDTGKLTEDYAAQYTPIVNEEGGILDDLIYYRKNADELIVTPNASNTPKIVDWVNQHNEDGQVNIVDESPEWGLIAVQGPKSTDLMRRVTDADLDAIAYYSYSPDETVAGVEGVQLSRTGYTGEEGYELYIPAEHTIAVWKKLLEEGQDLGVTECALGARDTLRLEAGMPLYGNEFDESVNPVAGGIAFAAPKAKEADYIGKQAIADYRAGDKKEASRGFVMEGKKIARPGMTVKNTDGEAIGVVTSGTKSPTFGKALGFVRVDANYKVGDKVLIEVRNADIEAELTKKDWLAHR